MNIDQDYLRSLRLLGVVEGISTLILFGVAMPLKYFGDLPIAVTIVGPIHGLLFLALALRFYFGIEKVPIPRNLAYAGIGAAVIPFGPFVMDRYLTKLEG